jgi:hypothetical protein
MPEACGDEGDNKRTYRSCITRLLTTSPAAFNHLGVRALEKSKTHNAEVQGPAIIHEGRLKMAGRPRDCRREDHSGWLEDLAVGALLGAHLRTKSVGREIVLERLECSTHCEHTAGEILEPSNLTLSKVLGLMLSETLETSSRSSKHYLRASSIASTSLRIATISTLACSR